MRNVKGLFVDVLYYIVGCFICAVAVDVFFSPNEISPGGFTGIASALASIINIPSGIILFSMNLPVLIIGYLNLGGKFIVKTAMVSILLSASLTLADIVFKGVYIDKILASIFGGILMGLGLSMVMLRGATTGGVDIIAKLVNRKYRHLTVGKLILILDGIVITVAAIVYKNVESVLYSVVAIYVTSRMMDAVLYGSDTGKTVYIITRCHNSVCKDINEIMHRGVTLIPIIGGYTGEEKAMLFCTVRRHEVSAVYEIVEKYDDTAFIVVGDAGEIIGEGFKNMR